ncbi:LLM class flavin-dependent oxidoreductase [Paenibacillus sp. MER 180]|uniref:MupA/Atu3671 family FMN-dependent luciferase-like monooxygenase n=1 Tax=Paenibacillus sp. MER 180 TaxID=2939570 RepID=UPI00203BE2FF|nr:MupA/Atu3671 family FMN-dependent luciferase-like monooxygenase [Paenibacillus sp. MER 180]MCM3291599.1 LLM class flavin-dependent oxidoreductase [Paenibacillus sp. MER 180]
MPNDSDLIDTIQGLKQDEKVNKQSGESASTQSAEKLPLSFAQERIWFMEQLHPETPIYNEGFILHLNTLLNFSYLQQSIVLLAERHESLRTVLYTESDKVYQRVLDSLPIDIQQFEPSWDNKDDLQKKLNDMARAMALKPFNLSEGPLFRVGFVKIAEHESAVIVAIHHIISDAQSMSMFFQELSELYLLLVAQKRCTLSTGGPTYSQYSIWQREYMQDDGFQSQLNYWVDALQDAPPLLNLSAIGTRPKNRTSKGAKQEIKIPSHIVAKIQSVCKAAMATPYMVTKSALIALLYRYTGQKDIVIGSTMLNRNHPDTEQIIGLFMNNIALRTSMSDYQTFRSLLHDVKETMLSAYEHSECPFEKVVEAINPTRDLSYSPIFQVLYTYLNNEPQHDLFHATNCTVSKVDTGIVKYDLSFTIDRRGNELILECEYSFDLFTNEIVSQMLKHYCILLNSGISHLDIPITELDMLTQDEKDLMLDEWNATDMSLPEKCIHQLIEAQVNLTPDAIAVVFEDRQVTYKDLNHRANQIAVVLRNSGVTLDTIVGIYLERSDEMIAGMLGVLKAGGKYLPLDPTIPVHRLNGMIEDSGLSVVVSQTGLKKLAVSRELTILSLENINEDDDFCDPSNKVSLKDQAYVIYTSGSTGQPKGVQISHGNILNFFVAMQQKIKCGPNDTVLAVTSIGFDISILELLWPLSQGAKVIIASDEAMFRKANRIDDTDKKSPIDFSLSFFSSLSNLGQEQYNLIFEATKYADQNKFTAVWMPERHFDEFGGLFPNPSVVGAALAMITNRISIRAGSVVLPLHHPFRVVEEWSVVDNISNGRVGISFASGWHPDDFVFNPDHFQDRADVLIDYIPRIKSIWRGEEWDCINGEGRNVSLKVQPVPIQKELPVWVTTSGSADTYIQAGRIGANVLTHLIGQSIQQLEHHIQLYHKALIEHGHNPKDHKISLMMHTFVGESNEQVRAIAYEPVKRYLQSSANLIKKMEHVAYSNPSGEEMEQMRWNRAADVYFEQNGLLGDVAHCTNIVRELKAIGVNEICCLIDFGIEKEQIIEHLEHLNLLRQKCIVQKEPYSLEELIHKHDVTIMQCTPSLMEIVLSGMNRSVSRSSLKTVLLGGERLSVHLKDRIYERFSTINVYNMYGPTETTVWSSVQAIDSKDSTILVGKPVANTQFYIVDSNLNLLPIGVVGELCIGGMGVATGYLNNIELTNSKFINLKMNNEGYTKVYRTGDLARFHACGSIELLGRSDNQVKIRGHRIESGEIENVLLRYEAIEKAVVTIIYDEQEQPILSAFIVLQQGDARKDKKEIIEFLSERLPGAFVPTHLVYVDKLPLLSSGKIDMAALKKWDFAEEMDCLNNRPRTATESKLEQIWCEILNRKQLDIYDNFFIIGGHSLLAIRLVNRINEVFKVGVSMRTIFEAPTIEKQAAYIYKYQLSGIDVEVLNKLLNKLEG